MKKGEDLKLALIALNIQGKKPVRLADIYVYIHYSHPPLIQRLAEMDRLMKLEKPDSPNIKSDINGEDLNSGHDFKHAKTAMNLG